MKSVALTLFSAVALLTVLGSAPKVSLAQETPTASVTPGAGPAPPTNVQIDIGRLLVTWTDNSGNEDGFRVVFVAPLRSGDTYRQEQATGANATSVTLSPVQYDDRVEVTVIAFNSAGESPSVTLGRSLDSGPSATTTPPRTQLPPTGVGLDRDAADWMPIGLIYVLGGFVLALGLACVRRPSS
jgi:hypothetical protein